MRSPPVEPRRTQRAEAPKPETWPAWATAIAVLAILLAWSPTYVSHLLVVLGIYLLLAYSLNLVTGFGGLIVFCQAIFYGIGAYAYALSRLRTGAPGAQVEELLWTGNLGWVPGILLAGGVSALLAGGIGWICLRFRGDYFIFATLGFQMIVFVLLYNWLELTRGPFGIYGIARPSVLGWMAHEPWQYALLTGLWLLALLPPLFRLYRSPFGLSLAAMREDERAAKAMGIDTNAIAVRALAVAGGVAGVAGAIYAGYVTYIDPTSFSLRESIFILTLLLLGGGGNVKGPLAGSAVMLALPELLRFVGLPDAVAANVREIFYGALLAALMYWRPQGLAGATSIR